MTKYTFTFSYKDESLFRSILSRLDPDEYIVIKAVNPVDHKESDNVKYVDREAILEMDPEAALTFRLGMKELKIRRERTAEELKEEQELLDKHKVKITVKVNDLNSASNTP